MQNRQVQAASILTVTNADTVTRTPAGAGACAGAADGASAGVVRLQVQVLVHEHVLGKVRVQVPCR